MIAIKNKRLLFEIKHHRELDRFSSHAKGPNAVLIDNFVRIFFSANIKDNAGGGVTSHVVFVDFDLEFENILSIAKEDCISLGNPGCYDEHGIFPINPFFINDKLFAFTTGWSRRESVDVDTSIGIVKSTRPFINFERIGDGPLISANVDEPYLVLDPYVIKITNNYLIYYCYGDKYIYDEINKKWERSYLISMARSSDLNFFERTSRFIIPKLDDDEVQAYPTVLSRKGLYHMIFCFRSAFDFRKNPSRSYKFGYAFSNDGINWLRDDNKLIDLDSHNENDFQMKAYPSFFSVGEDVYLLYNGNNFGESGFMIAKLEF
jgi:hypothetical protein